ncbi:MAG: MipA/OmpV family protein [Hyphomicrobiaceae bacterium]|nr:MipA/OmpV family protein [Hyphomicrobiaceae bacterium]
MIISNFAQAVEEPGLRHKLWPNSWSLSTLISIKPSYEGSDKYKFQLVPALIPNPETPASFIDIRGTDDIRLTLLKRELFEVGPTFGYHFGRNQKDGRKLKGLGNVENGLVLGGFIKTSLLSSIDTSLSYHHEASGDINGNQFRLSFDYEMYSTSTAYVFSRLVATYADGEHMSQYFGVTEIQQRNSQAGLKKFNANAGIKGVSLSLGGKLELFDAIKLNLKGRYGRLIGYAANSPVIETKNQFLASIGITFSL